MTCVVGLDGVTCVAGPDEHTAVTCATGPDVDTAVTCAADPDTVVAGPDENAVAVSTHGSRAV